MGEARHIARAVRDTAGLIAGEVLRPCARSIATAIALLAEVGRAGRDEGPGGVLVTEGRPPQWKGGRS
jgi:hypothetical protein